jgi:uncharacterized protein
MTVVIVLAKAPLPGVAKTRMTPPLSPEQAASIAAAALDDTLAAACACTLASSVMAVFDGDPVPWLPADVASLPQADGGLDRRLAAAFDDVLTRTGEAMVLVAMDTPQVTAAVLDEAIDALAAPDVDAVFGPADDGGFWLIGLRALRSDERATGYAPLFHGVPMSTDGTGAAQRARLVEHGWRVHDIETLRDIDLVDDLAAIATAHPHLAVSQLWRRFVSPSP